MKPTLLIALLSVLILSWCGPDLLLTGAAGQAPTAQEARKIANAAPGNARVEMEKPAKVLVFSLSFGYKHSAIPYGKAALEIMAAKTGAYEAVLSNDISLFEAHNLAQFDAVVFNNTNNEIFLPENYAELTPEEKVEAEAYDALLKQNLVDYLSRGGGLMVIHAGVASFRKWPEFGNIIGARFDNHPWNSGSKVTLKIEEPEHPLTQAFEAQHFEISDEIYQLKGPYSRDEVRVLLSIDVDKTNMNVGGIHRKDLDFPITYIKSYGKGRVFYCALGHQHDLFWNPVILRHLLDGVQYATGDLEASNTPSAKLEPAGAKGEAHGG